MSALVFIHPKDQRAKNGIWHTNKNKHYGTCIPKDIWITSWNSTPAKLEGKEIVGTKVLLLLPLKLMAKVRCHWLKWEQNQGQLETILTPPLLSPCFWTLCMRTMNVLLPYTLPSPAAEKHIGSPECWACWGGRWKQDLPFCEWFCPKSFLPLNAKAKPLLTAPADLLKVRGVTFVYVRHEFDPPLLTIYPEFSYLH